MGASNLVKRLATLEDANLLLEWRNHPETRRASLQSEVVSLQEHQEWLSQALSSSSRKIYIYSNGEVPVGTVRIDRARDGSWELSWTTAPEVRGLGWGKHMVRDMSDSLSQENLTARVREGNLASIKIAAFAGFTESHRAEGIIFFIRPHC
jgi:RimJ/RimL family protein N-acetyltransferase